MEISCLCCREKGHTSKEFMIRKEEEKMKRTNYRVNQNIKIKKEQQERAKY